MLDCFSNFSVISKRNNGSVKEQEKHDKKTTVNHSGSSLRVFSGFCSFLYLISLAPGIPVLECKQNAGNYVYCKNCGQPFAENGDYKGMAVELIRISLKKRDSYKKSGIPGGMTTEK